MKDVIAIGIAGGTAAQQVVCAYHLLHRLDTAMHPHHTAGFI